MAKPLKLFYASDIHGSEKCFLKFLNAGRFYGVDVLILGGDITGKVVVPLIADGRGGYHARFLGGTHETATEADTRALEQAVRMNGFYPVRMTREEHAALEQDPQGRDALFRQVVTASLYRWLELAEERLAGGHVRCFVNAGNDDEWYVDEVLGHSTVIENGDGRVVDLDDHHQMLTVGYSNRTPFASPRELEEPELEAHIRSLARGLSNPRRAVFTVHVPPARSGLDDAPALDPDGMRVVTRGGHTVMAPVGSEAVRTTVRDLEPLLGLHGHVHESRGAKRLGPSLCLNPGSEYGEGVLKGALVTLGPDRVLGYQLVSA